MRKRYINILAACAAMIFIASCGKEQPQQSEPEAEALEELTVEAEVATKTVMNTDNTVDWSVSDAISVFSTAYGVNRKFGSSHSAVSHLTTFSGKIESGTTEVLALYPYTASAAYSGGTITGMSIPTTQTATESSFANGASVTIAKGTKAADAKTVVLLFDNLCSVLKFTVPEGIKQSSSIRVESINSNVKMSGAVTINSATPAITSASESYVELSGTFTGGKTYCVTVAPGNYDQGFRFTITGTNNTPLVREAPAVNAVRGEVYTIGALNPALDGNAASISGSIQHTYENSTLTGSTASVTVTYPEDEFASNIKGWKLKNVTMKKDASVLYRSLPDGTAFTNGQPITLNQESDMPYMPQGSYTFSADIYYTVNKADGTPVDKFLKTVTTTVTSPAPDASKFTLTASPTGYTSYSVYKGTDGQTASAANANNVKNDVIKGIGAQYTGGLSSQVYTQCSNLLSFTATYKNGDSYYSPDANGNSAEWLSWGEHKVKCTSATFDGVTQSCNSEKTVYITGLPYKLAHVASKSEDTHNHVWKPFQEDINFYSDNIDLKPTAAKEPIIQSPYFSIPSTINVKLTGYVTSERDIKDRLQFKPNGVEKGYIVNINNDNPWNGDNNPVDAEMAAGNYQWDIQWHMYANLFKHAHIYSFNIDYR